MRPGGHQPIIGLANMIGCAQQIDCRLSQGFGTDQIHPFGSIQDYRVFRPGKSLSGGEEVIARQLHIGHKGFQGRDFFTVVVAQAKGRRTIQLGGAWVSDDQRRPALGRLFDPQPPDRGLFLQVAGDHQDRGAFAPVADVAPRGEPSMGYQVSTADRAEQESFTALRISELLKVEQVLVGQAPAREGDQLGASETHLFGDLAQRFFPGGRDELAIFTHQRLGEPPGASGSAKW